MELLVIAYHYIDDEDKYKAGIYPTSPARLTHQLNAIRKNYEFISENDLVRAIKNEISLPDRACLITFDDGLRSQYERALPILEDRVIPAVFYIPTQHITEQKAYRAHKIHFLLSKKSIDILFSDVQGHYQDMVGKPLDWSGLDINRRAINWYRYDEVNTAKFKFFLNHFLDTQIAGKIIDRLFAQYYEGTEADFCNSLYLSKPQLQKLANHELIALGMHTHSHLNLDQFLAEIVLRDLAANYRILHNEIGVKNIRGISYTYGSITEQIFDKNIKKSFNALGLAYGFTTEKRLNFILNKPYLLSRFGANDITGGKRPIFEV